MTAALFAACLAASQNQPVMTEMHGYLIVPHEPVAQEYNAGFSMYVAAWPLLKDYPGSDFQSGLYGTWMFPQFDGEGPKDHYTNIEGGLGWWRDTRFATETPKFIMGGVALNFSEWANGPGAGKGRDWDDPSGKYGVAQLSPWVLWPPDGLNLKQGTNGELFGYGYLPLPLTDAKAKTAGADVPTGGQAWTLFLNTANFKGPVAFFTPYFWSKASVANPDRAGLFLDTRPSEPNRAVQMETQHIPAMVSQDSSGATFARVAPTRFPGAANRDVPHIHRITAYGKSAIWNGVEAWLKGGPASKGAVDSRASAVHKFGENGYSTWKIKLPNKEDKDAPEVDWSSFGVLGALSDSNFGMKWSRNLLRPENVSDPLVTLPQYYKLTADDNGKERWVAVRPQDVPVETGLQAAVFPEPVRPTEPYVTPDEGASSWKAPGPMAGPFTRRLGDGSEVTYSWYRFADQPALLNADLTAAEREAIQKRVEKIHRSWKKDGKYLPDNTVGSLASIDPALIVSPPRGREIGYVPIVTRQGWPASR